MMTYLKRGFVYACLSTGIGLLLWFFWVVIFAVNPIIGLLMLLPMVPISLIFTGWMVSWVVQKIQR